MSFCNLTLRSKHFCSCVFVIQCLSLANLSGINISRLSRYFIMLFVLWCQICPCTLMENYIIKSSIHYNKINTENILKVKFKEIIKWYNNDYLKHDSNAIAKYNLKTCNYFIHFLKKGISQWLWLMLRK